MNRKLQAKYCSPTFLESKKAITDSNERERLLDNELENISMFLRGTFKSYSVNYDKKEIIIREKYKKLKFSLKTRTISEEKLFQEFRSFISFNGMFSRGYNFATRTMMNERNKMNYWSIPSEIKGFNLSLKVKNELLKVKEPKIEKGRLVEIKTEGLTKETEVLEVICLRDETFYKVKDIEGMVSEGNLRELNNFKNKYKYLKNKKEMNTNAKKN